ncbi:hypothetical protein PR048_002284 [Dryococelus australis]|uniref:Uncharacterized protein n=1 Tax=Dryococelus australis TaxID=614101 RepID=A0ABQ9IJS1_9NEOP|nr:hypothetical protein PR048_002284 [Dryococelus australis]
MNMDVTAEKLNNRDRLVTFFTKKMLHLPITTPHVFLYTPMRSGGSIPCLLQVIGTSCQRRLVKLEKSGDAQVVTALKADTGRPLQEKFTRMIKPELISKKVTWSYWCHQVQHNCLGNGVAECNVPGIVMDSESSQHVEGE